MGHKSKPRAGSLAFYPRKKAKKETQSFSSFPKIEGEAKPLNFFAYKAGMLHLKAKNVHAKSITAGQEIFVPATVLECPTLKVFGIRAYAKTPYGKKVLKEVWSEKTEKHLERKLHGLKKKKKHSFEDLKKLKEEIFEVRLLVHTQPFLTGIGKKKPEISEIALSGGKEKQLEYAKQKLGQEIAVQEVFSEKDFADVKAVTKGKGMQGVVKRFGVKDFGHKAKKHRAVGSISPWNPHTVMWTVARPGQMGYHSRTEYNKRVLVITEAKKANKKAGFEGYGVLKNTALIVAGSVPGPEKRLVALRKNIRNTPKHKWQIEEAKIIGAGT